MNYLPKSIFVGSTMVAVAAMLVVSSSGLLQDASATILRDRVNKVLDEHIERSEGTAHGDAVKEIREKFNGGSGRDTPRND